ncbi:MAG: hypothetical protein E7Y34_02975, partial [Mycoplasma sp.]|nr:hypothetical protein [Mycoplasma sp.]
MIKKPDWFKEIFSRLATTKQHKLRQEINAWKREQIKELKFFSSQHSKTKKPTPQEQKEFKKKWYWPHIGEINKLASQAFRQINPAEEQLKKLYKQAKNPKYNYRLKLEKGLNVLG